MSVREFMFYMKLMILRTFSHKTNINKRHRLFKINEVFTMTFVIVVSKHGKLTFPVSVPTISFIIINQVRICDLLILSMTGNT